MLNTSSPSAAAVAVRPARRWATSLTAIALLAALGACSSGVKLDQAPVEDRSTGAVAPVNQGAAGAAGVGSGSGAVSNVDASSTGSVQPAGLARVVYFDYDSFEVRPEFAAALEAHAKYLAANRTRRVALEGHTDERGGREYNLALGQKRAEAVRRALTLLGVRDQQVEPVSFGEEKPAASGFTEDAYAKNRRVEFTYR